MFEIDSALRTLVERGGSDLHVKVAAPPTIRLHGELEPLEGFGQLTGEETEKAFHDIAEVRSLTEFEQEGEADFSYALPGVSRYRVNVFKQRGSTSIVCRAIPFEIRSVEDLGLPKVVTDLAEEQRGIILVTGTTGSGKSTTLAAMIDHINRTRSHHIVTLEDPIEYLHEDKGSIVNQREVGSDTKSFARAMRRVLRQDPDVILIGEMRDEETVRTALSAAETGHLVLSTVHTLDATETINRIIDFFPPHLQHQARVMLASTLRGAIAQRLVPDVTGSRPRAGLRGARRHRPRPGPDPQSRRNRQDHRSDRRGRVLRHAHLRPVAARLRDGGQGGGAGRARLRLQPARLQADARRRRPARQRHRAAREGLVLQTLRSEDEQIGLPEGDEVPVADAPTRDLQLVDRNGAPIGGDDRLSVNQLDDRVSRHHRLGPNPNLVVA